MQNDKDLTKNKYLSSISNLNSKKNQKFFGIILTFCALSFFGFFAIKPTASTIFKLQKEISDNEIVFNRLETKIKNLTQLRTQYSILQNDLPVITNAITIEPEATLLFAQIQSVGKTSNIIIKKLQNLEVQIIKNNNSPESNYYSDSFSISGIGSSENIYKFVQSLTNMERIVNIDTFSINSVTDQQEESLGFTIQGTAFFKSNL